MRHPYFAPICWFARSPSKPGAIASRCVSSRGTATGEPFGGCPFSSCWRFWAGVARSSGRRSRRRRWCAARSSRSLRHRASRIGVREQDRRPLQSSTIASSSPRSQPAIHCSSPQRLMPRSSQNALASTQVMLPGLKHVDAEIIDLLHVGWTSRAPRAETAGFGMAEETGLTRAGILEQTCPVDTPTGQARDRAASAVRVRAALIGAAHGCLGSAGLLDTRATQANLTGIAAHSPARARHDHGHRRGVL